MFTLFFEERDGLSAVEQAVYHAEELATLFSDPIFRYVIVNIEVAPTTGRVHWQGYMELMRTSRFAYIKAQVPLLEDAHFEVRMGTSDEAIAYCSKLDSRHPDVNRFYEVGQRSGGQGHRSDLETLANFVKEGKSVREIAEEMPGMYIRYHGGIAAMMAAVAPEPVAEVDFQPRPWQQLILDFLETEPNDRTIFWVTDSQGGNGKSRLTNFLVRNHKAQALSGRLQDMTYAYSMEPSRIVCFDITRAAADCSKHLYTMGESLKNGWLFVQKYQSRRVFFQPPHVIYFSNSTWDHSLFSKDRVVEITLTPGNWDITYWADEE